MRCRYKNGDEVQLVSCGCDGCIPDTINGVLCHEQGCPFAWRDYPKVCAACGEQFYSRHGTQKYCGMEDCRPD